MHPALVPLALLRRQLPPNSFASVCSLIFSFLLPPDSPSLCPHCPQVRSHLGLLAAILEQPAPDRGASWHYRRPTAAPQRRGRRRQRQSAAVDEGGAQVGCLGGGREAAPEGDFDISRTPPCTGAVGLQGPAVTASDRCLVAISAPPRCTPLSRGRPRGAPLGVPALVRWRRGST
jgi:hypothetical protein